jgi:hypothetical protein
MLDGGKVLEASHVPHSRSLDSCGVGDSLNSQIGSPFPGETTERDVAGFRSQGGLFG